LFSEIGHRVGDSLSNLLSFQSLQGGESKYRTLVENIPQKIFLKDKNSVYVSGNENCARDFNLTSDELTGKTDYDLFPKELADKYRQADREIMATGKTSDFEEPYEIDGQQFWVHTIKTPVRDGAGNVSGLLGIYRDITERKQADERLRQKDLDIKKAYVDVFSAVTGGKLIIATPEEIGESLGRPLSGKENIRSYRSLSKSRKKIENVIAGNFKPNENIRNFIVAVNEGLTNSIKHAGRARFQVFEEDGLLQVEVSDNGPGISFSALPKATFLSGYSTKNTLGVGFTVMLEFCDKIMLSTQPGHTGIVLGLQAELLEGRAVGLDERMQDEVY